MRNYTRTKRASDIDAQLTVGRGTSHVSARTEHNEAQTNIGKKPNSHSQTKIEETEAGQKSDNIRSKREKPTMTSWLGETATLLGGIAGFSSTNSTRRRFNTQAVQGFHPWVLGRRH